MYSCFDSSFERYVDRSLAGLSYCTTMATKPLSPIKALHHMWVNHDEKRKRNEVLLFFLFVMACVSQIRLSCTMWGIIAAHVIIC